MIFDIEFRNMMQDWQIVTMPFDNWNDAMAWAFHYSRRSSLYGRRFLAWKVEVRK